MSKSKSSLQNSVDEFKEAFKGSGLSPDEQLNVIKWHESKKRNETIDLAVSELLQLLEMVKEQMQKEALRNPPDPPRPYNPEQ